MRINNFSKLIKKTPDTSTPVNNAHQEYSKKEVQKFSVSLTGPNTNDVFEYKNKPEAVNTKENQKIQNLNTNQPSFGSKTGISQKKSPEKPKASFSSRSSQPYSNQNPNNSSVYSPPPLPPLVPPENLAEKPKSNLLVRGLGKCFSLVFGFFSYVLPGGSRSNNLFDEENEDELNGILKELNPEDHQRISLSEIKHLQKAARVKDNLIDAPYCYSEKFIADHIPPPETLKQIPNLNKSPDEVLKIWKKNSRKLAENSKKFKEKQYKVDPKKVLKIKNLLSQLGINSFSITQIKKKLGLGPLYEMYLQKIYQNKGLAKENYNDLIKQLKEMIRLGSGT